MKTSSAPKPQLTDQSGKTLDFAFLREQEPSNPGRVLRRALTMNAAEDGLSYKSCQALKTLLDEGFVLNGTRGVWDNITTARNMTFVALDTIPGFRKPRTSYVRLLQLATRRELAYDELSKLDTARTAISKLLYTHILSNGEGAGSEFITNAKLTTLTSAPRAFLERMDSFGALIRFALPGIIDEERAGCVRPHHIEHFHLNDPQYCERLFIRTLSADLGNQISKFHRTQSLPPDAPAHQRSTRELANAIRETILDQPGGGEAWLIARGVSSLLSRQSLHLESQSFGGLLQRFFPQVINQNDPLLIQPHEIRYGLWNDQNYARLQILRAFATHIPKIPGVREFCRLAEAKKAIPKEVRLFAYENAQTIACREFIAQGRLQSIHIRPPTFISSSKTASLEEIARFCFEPEK
jgi:hypothetical protein